MEYIYYAYIFLTHHGAPFMQLTRYTDYTLRVLIHLAAHPGRLSSIAEIARAYGISHNHLMKVVHELGKSGLVEGVRGRAGGIRLARRPEAINVGKVVRATEDGFEMADCGSCVIAPACGLSGALGEAVAAFLAVLDRYTLADLVQKQSKLARLLAAGPPAAAAGG
jgi:Rrf2 family nitric oxide-sensitive transcriptional repressor